MVEGSECRQQARVWSAGGAICRQPMPHACSGADQQISRLVSCYADWVIMSTFVSSRALERVKQDEPTAVITYEE